MDGIMKRIVVAVVLFALVGLAACGDSESPRVSRRSEHWSAMVDRADAGDGAKEYLPIALPEAHNGLRDEWDFRAARRLVLNVGADGVVRFKVWEFQLAKDDARERAQAVEALASALKELKEDAAANGGAGDPPLEGLMLHLDRGCMWRDAADCIRAVRAATIPIDWLQVAVRAPETTSYHTLDMTLRNAEPETGQGLQIHVRREHDGVTEVQFGGRSSAFSPGDAFESAAFLAGANRQWARIETAVRAPRESVVALLTVEDSVRWAYVVKLLDILLEPTQQRVVFPAEGFALSLRRN